MRRKLAVTIATLGATLVCAAPAGAHDGLGDWDVRPYCGDADGGFLHVQGGFGGITFDRFVPGSTRIVTPGAPSEPSHSHAVFKTYDHFYFGFRYREERFCGWFVW